MHGQVNDPVAILQTLERHGVLYVVIGGFAALVHGSPYPTYDVDVTPDMSKANLQRLADALNAINPRLHVDDDHEPDGAPVVLDATMLARAEIWNLITDLGNVDIVVKPGASRGYVELSGNAERTEIADGLTVAVASLEDVIRTKAAAGREKDFRVLPELRALSERRNRDTQ